MFRGIIYYLYHLHTELVGRENGIRRITENQHCYVSCESTAKLWKVLDGADWAKVGLLPTELNQWLSTNGTCDVLYPADSTARNYVQTSSMPSVTLGYRV